MFVVVVALTASALWLVNSHYALATAGPNPEPLVLPASLPGLSAGKTLTALNPMLIKDVYSGTNSGILTQFDRTQMIAMNGVLYFTGSTCISGIELWKSDGTSSGTVMVKDIRPGMVTPGQPILSY